MSGEQKSVGKQTSTMELRSGEKKSREQKFSGKQKFAGEQKSILGQKLVEQRSIWVKKSGEQKSSRKQMSLLGEQTSRAHKSGERKYLSQKFKVQFIGL